MLSDEQILYKVRNYACYHIHSLTETINDYIDDDKIKNASFIGELKEQREFWRDILRIISCDNENLYCYWWEDFNYEL